MKRSEIKRTKPLARQPFPPAEPKPAPGPRKRKCAVCREPFQPRSMTHKACKAECAQTLAVKVTAAQKAKQQRQERAQDKAKLEGMKKRTTLIAEAQAAFNLVVRLEDAALPCISCGRFVPDNGKPGGTWDAGHYLSRGAASHLRFDRRNVHKQCKGCNRPGGCTRDQHREGVRKRIGDEALTALESDQVDREYSKDDLREIRDSNRKRAAQLKKEKA